MSALSSHRLTPPHPASPRLASPRLSAPCWLALGSNDVRRAEQFYTTLFGWRANTAMPALGHGVELSAGPTPFGSIHPAATNGWTVYFGTDDLDGALATIADDAGRVLSRFGTPRGDAALAADPSGALFGLWQREEDYGIDDGPLTPVYVELHTTNYRATVPFYEDVFDWDLTIRGNTDEFRYATVDDDLRGVAGLLDAGRDRPPQGISRWLAYVAVADAGATQRRAIDLGGSVIEPAVSTPFGQLARIADPLGAVIKLVGGD